MPGHLRKRSSLDPFSDPDIYYGDEDSLRREIKERRRAFSSVGTKDRGRALSSFPRLLKLFRCNR
jgi:hypothetical protein